MKIDPKNTVFLIDGSSFLYRAYYGLKPLHTPHGIPVQAVFSFCRMIKKLIDTYTPEYIAIVWDSRGKTIRHELYQEYKATRQAAPSDLFDQKAYIVKFAQLIGLTQVEQQGVEADDIMYSIAKDRVAEGCGIIFVTLDKDMGQALTLGSDMYLLDAFKEKMCDRVELEEKLGFPLTKMAFYYALLGDTSDNIPGVKGIGDKTAVALVNQFDSLEDLYSRIHEIKKAGVTNALLAQKDNAFLSRKLFLLHYYPTGLTKNNLLFDPKGWNNARSLFQELNFKSLLATTGQTHEEKIDAIQEIIEYWKLRNFKTVRTVDELNKLCHYLKEHGSFAVDTETDGLQPLQVNLVGISVCWQDDCAYYIPCGHRTDEQQLSREVVIEYLKPILEDQRYKKYLHNAKYDALVLYHHGIELAGTVMDTLVAASLVTKEGQSASLKNLSQHYFNQKMLTYDDLVKTYKYKNFSYVPLDIAMLYSCADSLQTYRIAHLLEKELAQFPKINTLYYTIEHPLIEILCAMEKEGIYVDTTLLKQLDTKVVEELVTIEEKIGAIIGEKKINLNSPRQIEDLLFYKLHLPPQRKSATGKYSTDMEVLTALAKIHPIPGLIIKYRELAKLKSTYIDALPTYINPETGYIHTTFSQTTAATGRLASNNPNLQNIPVTGYGLALRAAFKPDRGDIFISADYSQIELRILAYLSQDKNLIDAFLQNRDIHRETAARLFDVRFEDVTHEQRQLGKRINFSILYGLTPYGLSKDLGISFKDAKRYIDRYFEQYHGVSTWMDEVIETTKKNGYVETVWGRRRYIPTIHERNRTLYEEACRIAINTVAQGTAAEIVKLGMIKVYGAIAKNHYHAKMVLQIHDELLLSVAHYQSQEVEKMIKKELEDVVSWNIPLIVTVRSGSDWREVTK